MDEMEEKIKRAVEHSTIHRARASDLFTFGNTKLPYIFVAESSINHEDTLVRRGQITTEKPSIVVDDAFSGPNFEGFEEDKPGMSLIFGRAFRFPAMNYANQHNSLEVLEKPLGAVIERFERKLEEEQDTKSALISGPEDCWAYSLIIYAGEMTQRSAATNIKDIFERHRLKF